MRAPVLTIRRSLLVLAILILMPIWLPSGLRIFGFYVDEPGWYVAKIAVENGKPASACRRIIMTPWNFLSPSTADQRALCIFDYARLTQDPSACELLMPSEYGWDCLGAVKGELWNGIGCGSAREKINCWTYGVSSPNLGINDCNVYDKKILRDWCHEERSASLPNVYECNEISKDPLGLQEICERRYAFKLKDPSLCTKMSNEEKRKLCEIEITAWQQYSDSWSFAK
ncbi:hypothetical protein AUJ46_05655 [Candidatus Peregrinibacteria bacterium CG1_02_54_53]|nr:MAG: hypothetical protein AUJ46_05655 [Candidatus Peregrinibacteria bacterium CG1_02_54_53]